MLQPITPQVSMTMATLRVRSGEAMCVSKCLVDIDNYFGRSFYPVFVLTPCHTALLGEPETPSSPPQPATTQPGSKAIMSLSLECVMSSTSFPPRAQQARPSHIGGCWDSATKPSPLCTRWLSSTSASARVVKLCDSNRFGRAMNDGDMAAVPRGKAW